MKFLALTAAALALTTVGAFAQGNTGTVTGDTPQTTMNGPHGGNPDANTIQSNNATESKAMHKAKKHPAPTSDTSNDTGVSNSANGVSAGH